MGAHVCVCARAPGSVSVPTLSSSGPPWGRHCWALILFAEEQGWGVVDCSGEGLVRRGEGSQASAMAKG